MSFEVGVRIEIGALVLRWKKRLRENKNLKKHRRITDTRLAALRILKYLLRLDEPPTRTREFGRCSLSKVHADCNTAPSPSPIASKVSDRRGRVVYARRKTHPLIIVRLCTARAQPLSAPLSVFVVHNTVRIPLSAAFVDRSNRPRHGRKPRT